MSKEAMKLAMEALELEDMACRYEKEPTPEHIANAITALRQAIEQQDQHEFTLRGVLASELKCWHRLTEDEANNLLAFFKRTAPQPAQRKPLTITEESAWDLARYVYARSNPHESPQILLSAMEIKQIIEAAHGIKGDA